MRICAGCDRALEALVAPAEAQELWPDFCPLCRVRISQHREDEQAERLTEARRVLKALAQQRERAERNVEIMTAAIYRERVWSTLDGDGRTPGPADDWTLADWRQVAARLEQRLGTTGTRILVMAGADAAGESQGVREGKVSLAT